jgi:type I restriction enzyme S subunit
MVRPTTLNSGVFVIRPSINELYPAFLQLVFKSHFFTDFLDRITAGSTIVHLYQKDIVDFDFPIPDIDTQLQIVKSISAIDKSIEAQKIRAAKYEAIKKATVNLLLKPKAGWRCVKLGDVFEVKVGGDLDLPHYSPNKTLDCRYEIVSNSLANHGHYGYTSLPKFPGNSITVTGRGNVGHAEYRQEPFDAIVRIVILSPNCSQVCSKFVAELINATDTFLIESTGVPQLTAPQISSTSIALPPLDEQRRIVGILDSIDGTINGLKSQLAKAKDIKQGMMSYFFG